MRTRYLLPLLLAVPLGASAQTAQDLTLQAPDGTAVTIDRDDYGVPHISAPSEEAVFFGQGFAVAQDRLFQMETFWRTATGRLAELQGPDALTQDQNIRTVYYTDAEREAQFEALPERAQTFFTAYVDGINAYIDSTAANPATYLPVQYAAGGFQPEPYTVNKVVATVQFFIRRFGEIGGNELTRLAELQANGQEWFDLNRPINDPEAATTIYDGAPATPTTPGAYDGPPVDPAIAQAVADAAAAQTQFLIDNGVPHKLGSFAAAISGAMTETGNVMLLGAPQMGQPRQDAKAITSEVELLVGAPDGDGLHVAGMTVPGIPGVIIGRTRDRAWTFTTGVTDNTDTYVETITGLGPGGVPTYLYDGSSIPAEVFVESIGVAGQEDETYVHFRTVHGPVIADDLANGLAYTYKYAFWMNELQMVEALFDIWEAESVEEFEAAAFRIPVSFNLFYADKAQDIAYWHVGDYPVRPEGTDPRLPLMGDGSEEWNGFLDKSEHPQSINPAQGYFANWNNKPIASWDQGDNVSWADYPTDPDNDTPRTFDGVVRLQQHLENSAPVSFQELQELTRVVRQHPEYPEYPATYQQVLEFSGFGSYAENVVPPGQSGFINIQGVPSANFSDQWAFYQSSTGDGPITMKPFTFIGATGVGTEGLPSGDTAFGFTGVYPNPAADRLTVGFVAEGDARVELYDLLGRRLATLHDGAATDGRTTTLDTASLPAGLYVLRLTAEGATQSRRFVVAR